MGIVDKINNYLDEKLNLNNIRYAPQIGYNVIKIKSKPDFKSQVEALYNKTKVIKDVGQFSTNSIYYIKDEKIVAK